MILALGKVFRRLQRHDLTVYNSSACRADSLGRWAGPALPGLIPLRRSLLAFAGVSSAAAMRFPCHTAVQNNEVNRLQAIYPRWRWAAILPS
ncbi:hypothetical protein LNP05_29535 [Klebsiella pneumoniae subsp. pneumoniae]|nr:hypothetical protein [Klebsiella pneumoniae subsp. pneumoniae]